MAHKKKAAQRKPASPKKPVAGRRCEIKKYTTNKKHVVEFQVKFSDEKRAKWTTNGVLLLVTEGHAEVLLAYAREKPVVGCLLHKYLAGEHMKGEGWKKVKAENMIRGNDLEELKAMHERSLENKRKKEAEKRRKEEEEQKRQEQERLEHMWHNEEVSCLARTFLLFALVTADELTFAPLVHLCG